MTARTVDPGRLVSVAPGDLVIGSNVRIDPQLDKTFIASIRERGVLEPIIAREDGDGRLVVLRGQRRTLTAVEVGLTAVPVVVVDNPDDVDRLTDQIHENDHRTGLTTQERLAGFEQLAAFGLSAAQIAKRTARPRPEVEAGLKVAASKIARDTMAKRPELTIDQAAALAEFEDDTDAVKQLLDAAKWGGFDHRASYLRKMRAETLARQAVADEITAAGVTLIDAPNFGTKPKELSTLHLGSGDVLKRHGDCPGHAAYVEGTWQGNNQVFKAAYVCTDPQQYGHKLRTGSYGTADGRPARAGDKSEEEREAARAERRDVIDSNRAWVAAETVRRAWLREFFTRKQPPKTAAWFIASSLAAGNHALRDALEAGSPLAHELLGLTKPTGYASDDRCKAVDEALSNASDARALMVGLALVLASFEAATGKHSWRSVNTATARYLQYLAVNGYELADVELRACGAKPSAPAPTEDGGEAGE